MGTGGVTGYLASVAGGGSRGRRWREEVEGGRGSREEEVGGGGGRKRRGRGRRGRGGEGAGVQQVEDGNAAGRESQRRVEWVKRQGCIMTL
jgi:hypothetical protein